MQSAAELVGVGRNSLNLDHKHVAVIGAGVAGLTAADILAGWGLRVSLFEKTPFLGGHAIQLNCKATDACVKCGACVADDKLRRATRHPQVEIHTGTQIDAISGGQPYQIAYRTHSPMVNAEKCDGCGICFEKCPVAGAISQGHAPHGRPYVAIRRDLCRYFDHAACTQCREACPQGAIVLSSQAPSVTLQADAILLSTGFRPYDPVDKPYGFGLFPNVITSLDAERLLREHTVMQRPSDGRPAERIAFVQCVGSRDARLGHPWCSKICCGSSLRMARLIQSRQEDAQITCFYIDVQTFGKDFQPVYRSISNNINMIRAIPGDIFRTDTDQLEVIYSDPQGNASTEAVFDIVVLSVGLLPAEGNGTMARTLEWTLDESGFLPHHGSDRHPAPQGIFTAGTATGPMTIAESVSSAEKSVYDMLRYLVAS
jgi:heterodisulfide reductase subunit A